MTTPTRQRNLPPLISQAEAGRIVGLAKQNIPAAILRGELEGVVGDDGKLKVTRASALRARKARERAAKLAA